MKNPKNTSQFEAGRFYHIILSYIKELPNGSWNRGQSEQIRKD